MTNVQADRWRWERPGRPGTGTLNLEVEGAGILLLRGPNACGKSTFLRDLAGVAAGAEPGQRSGSVLRDGRPPHTRDVCLVPQDLDHFFLGNTLQQELALRVRLAGLSPTAAAEATAAAIEGSGLEAAALRRPVGKLSAGQRRRLAVTAATWSKPPLVLLDEPLTQVDDIGRKAILDSVEQLAQHALVMVATHDPQPFEALEPRQALFESPPIEPRAFASPWPVATLGRARIAAAGLRTGPGHHARLRDIHLDLGPGVHAIIGRNGSGKTTLLRALFGFIPVGGAVRLGTADPLAGGPAAAARQAACSFEEPSRMFFEPTVGAELSAGSPGRDADHDAQRYGLMDQIHQSPFTLSGGESRRLVHAIVDARRRGVILLDDPTPGLDIQSFNGLMATLAAWRTHRCVLVTTHDARLLAVADSVHRLEGGRVSPARRYS